MLDLFDFFFAERTYSSQYENGALVQLFLLHEILDEAFF